MFADCVFIGPEVACETLANDKLERSVTAIRISELLSLQQWDIHCPEVVRGCNMGIRRQSRFICRSLATFNRNFHRPVTAGARRSLRCGRVNNTRNVTQPL